MNFGLTEEEIKITTGSILQIESRSLKKPKKGLNLQERKG